MFREYTAYLRSSDRTPKGVVHVVVDNDRTFYAGCSKVHPNDRFDKQFGRMVARNRAIFLQDGLARPKLDIKHARAKQRCNESSHLFLSGKYEGGGVKELMSFLTDHFEMLTVNNV